VTAFAPSERSPSTTGSSVLQYAVYPAMRMRGGKSWVQASMLTGIGPSRGKVIDVVAPSNRAFEAPIIGFDTRVGCVCVCVWVASVVVI
jgi:hypothetical protein